MAGVIASNKPRGTTRSQLGRHSGGASQSRPYAKQFAQLTQLLIQQGLRILHHHKSAHVKLIIKGVVHVFDLEGCPKATRAYAWSSPIEGSDKRRFYATSRRHPLPA